MAGCRVSELGEAIPSLTIDDSLAIALARKRRGLEPVRVVVAPQAHKEALKPLGSREPLPFVV